ILWKDGAQWRPIWSKPRVETDPQNPSPDALLESGYTPAMTDPKPEDAMARFDRLLTAMAHGEPPAIGRKTKSADQASNRDASAGSSGIRTRRDTSGDASR